MTRDLEDQSSSTGKCIVRFFVSFCNNDDEMIRNMKKMC